MPGMALKKKYLTSKKCLQKTPKRLPFFLCDSLLDTIVLDSHYLLSSSLKLNFLHFLTRIKFRCIFFSFLEPKCKHKPTYAPFTGSHFAEVFQALSFACFTLSQSIFTFRFILSFADNNKPPNHLYFIRKREKTKHSGQKCL